MCVCVCRMWNCGPLKRVTGKVSIYFKGLIIITVKGQLEHWRFTKSTCLLFVVSISNCLTLIIFCFIFLKQCSALQKFTQRHIMYRVVMIHICGHVIRLDVLYNTTLQRRTVDLLLSVNEVHDCQPHEFLIFCKQSHFFTCKKRIITLKFLINTQVVNNFHFSRLLAMIHYVYKTYPL